MAVLLTARRAAARGVPPLRPGGLNLGALLPHGGASAVAPSPCLSPGGPRRKSSGFVRSLLSRGARQSRGSASLAQKQSAPAQVQAVTQFPGPAAWYTGGEESIPWTKCGAARGSADARLEHDFNMEHGTILGTGGYAVVKRATRRGKGGGAVAVKTQSRSSVSLREVQMLQRLGAPAQGPGPRHVSTCIAVYEDADVMHMVFELYEGGDLFDWIMDRDAEGHSGLAEADASDVLRQVLCGLQHCHARSVVHMDVKPENIMFRRKPGASRAVVHSLNSFHGLGNCSASNGAVDGATEAVLIDAGHAHHLPFLAEDTAWSVQGGSLSYMAPELLEQRKCGLKSDMWSLGVTAYAMLTGFPPWEQQGNPLDISQAVCRGHFDRALPEWAVLSGEAQDLVERLLCVDPRRRLSVEGALRHDFIAKHASVSPLETLGRMAQVA